MTIRLWLLIVICGLAMAAQALGAERCANGLRLIIHPTTASQVVSAELLLDYSSVDEPADYRGLRRVLLGAMLQGSRQHSGTEIQHALDEVGGVLEGRIHPTAIEFTVTMPAGALNVGLSALAEIVCHPQLTDEAVQTALEAGQRDLQNVPVGARETALSTAQRLLFANHPFANGGNGMPESLANITPALASLSSYRTSVPLSRRV